MNYINITELIPTINNFIIIFSIIGIIIGFVILILNLFKVLVKKDLAVLGVFFSSSFLIRFLFGSFGPWRQQEHYFEIFFGLKENFLHGKILKPSYIYNASGGLFEALYGIPLKFFSEFNVYAIYYTSLVISMASGLLIFLLALKLFKNKKIAFISYLIFSFLPILIKISSSEIFFILNGFSLLLVVNYALYLREKRVFWWDYMILLSLLSANLVGRLEYTSFFPILIFCCLILFSFIDERFRNYLKNNFKIKAVLSLFLIVSGFYLIYYVFPLGSNKELEYRLSQSTKWRDHLNFFRYTNVDWSIYPFLRAYFTPLYFYILFLATFVLILIKKKWKTLAIILLSIPFLLFYSTNNLGDFRRIMPLLLLFIPFMGWTFFNFLKYIKIPKKNILIVASFVIILSPLQNIDFLNTRIGRGIEQDFIIKNIEEIPPNSLILTTHDPIPQYNNYKFEKNGNKYRYIEKRAVFNNYLIPERKKIKVMDIYTEYDEEIINEYENVFYYRGLYSYHEKEAPENSGSGNEKTKTPWEATVAFENNHKLKPLAEKKIKNVSFNVGRVKHFKQGRNYSINAYGDLLVGFYKVKGFK